MHWWNPAYNEVAHKAVLVFCTVRIFCVDNSKDTIKKTINIRKCQLSYKVLSSDLLVLESYDLLNYLNKLHDN